MSKTVCVTPQNSPIDDWMSFPVKRSQKFSRNLPIRVKADFDNSYVDVGDGYWRRNVLMTIRNCW